MVGGSSEQWDWSMGDLLGITRYLVLDGGFCPSPSVTEDCTRSGVGEAGEQRNLPHSEDRVVDVVHTCNLEQNARYD